MRPLSVSRTIGAVTTAAPMYWMMALTRMSSAPAVRFCQIVPSVIDSMAMIATASASGGAPVAELRQDHQHGSDKSEPDPEPAPGRHPLAEKRHRQKPGHQRLKPDDQRGDAGRQPVLDRPENAAEIKPVQQHACHQAVAPRPRRAARAPGDATMTTRTAIAST